MGVTPTVVSCPVRITAMNAILHTTLKTKTIIPAKANGVPPVRRNALTLTLSNPLSHPAHFLNLRCPVIFAIVSSLVELVMHLISKALRPVVLYVISRKNVWLAARPMMPCPTKENQTQSTRTSVVTTPVLSATKTSKWLNISALSNLSTPKTTNPS